MIDQEKILGHREPYNGMGEAVGLLRQMSNSSEAKWANELKIKDQGRKEPAKRPQNRDQEIRDKNQRTRNRKDIKKHQENAPKKEQARRITHDKIRQSTHATRTPTPSQVRSHARQHKDKASPNSPGAQIHPPTLIVQHKSPNINLKIDNLTPPE